MFKIQNIILIFTILTNYCYATANPTYEDLKKADNSKRLTGNGMKEIKKGIKISTTHPNIKAVSHIKEYIPYIKKAQQTFEKEKVYFSEDVINYYGTIKEEINYKIKQKSLTQLDAVLFHYKISHLRSKKAQNEKKFNYNLPIEKMYLENKYVLPCCLSNPLMDYVPMVVGILFDIYPMPMKKYKKGDLNPTSLTYSGHGQEYSIPALLGHDYDHLKVFQIYIGTQWPSVQSLFKQTFLHALKSKEEKIFKESIAALFLILHETLIPLNMMDLKEKSPSILFCDLIKGSQFVFNQTNEDENSMRRKGTFFKDLHHLLHTYAGLEFKNHPNSNIISYYVELKTVAWNLLERFKEYHLSLF